MNDVLQAFRDLVHIFEGMHLPYVVIGGLAVRAYGIPRATYDVDFTISISRERLDDLYSAVEKAGHSVLECYRAGWVDTVANMPLIKLRTYIHGKGVDVDVFLAETPFQKEIIKRRHFVDTVDAKMWLATPEDIILLKLAAYRPRDKLDISDILFTQGELDQAYLRYWSEKLLVTDRLDEMISQAEGS